MTNGLIIIDKPKDYTSRDIVNIIEKHFDTPKVGHAGTLDPLATGILIIATGTALKALEFITDDIKEYIATVKMGILTDTLDVTGNIIKEDKNINIDKSTLEQTLKTFVGKYDQEVPLYSSVRVNGKRLYSYARGKESVELPKREIEIYDIELLSLENDEFTFRATVSKGTYIRSLIRDIGDKLNILCTMKELRRTRQGEFTLDDAITLEDLHNDNIKYHSIEKALTNIKFITADAYLENRIKNGSILENRYNDKIIGFKNKNNEVIALYQEYEKDKTRVKPLKTFINNE